MGFPTFSAWKEAGLGDMELLLAWDETGHPDWALALMATADSRSSHRKMLSFFVFVLYTSILIKRENTVLYYKAGYINYVNVTQAYLLENFRSETSASISN